jgi:DNA-binding response OmpR family regulator
VKRALVCEDDGPIRSLVTHVVQREGFKVDSVGDGAEALDKLKDDNYDLLILDLMMPQVDGFEVLRRLRERMPSQLRRVIVMTAVSQNVAGFIDPICTFLPKPFDIDRLTAAVRDCARIAPKKR